MLSIRIRLFIVLSLAFTTFLSAQRDELGNWLMYFGTNKFHPSWSVHTEAQYRSHTVSPQIEQLLLRTGLNYHVDPSFILTLGYGYITNHEFDSPQKGPERTEHRIFQQLILKNSLSRLFFEHRYRVEQRWVEGDYAGRLRYRLQLTVPINKTTLEAGSVFFNFYDEIFINTRRDYFDRNRLYGALGYQFSPSTSIQVGILNQAVSAFDKWHLQLAVFFNPDLTK